MNRPFVSIILPCFNEASFIRGVLADIAAQSYPADRIETWIVDGMSTDGTPEIVREWSASHPEVHLLDNPDRFVPQAMNKGIRASGGEVILRMDAHASFPPDYVEKLVRGLEETGADNVGGIWITRSRSDGATARAIAAVLSHPLGVGNALFRIGAGQPTEADTVPFGCYRREVFDRYGYYDERLIRNQDIELNKRIRANGGRIMLLPEVWCTYFARDTYRALANNNYQNGLWVVRTARFTQQFSSLSLRHFGPLFFVLYLMAAMLLSFCGLWIAWIPFAFYLLLTGLAAFRIAAQERSVSLFFPAWVAFFVLHLSYGLGSLKGLSEWKKVAGR